MLPSRTEPPSGVPNPTGFATYSRIRVGSQLGATLRWRDRSQLNYKVPETRGVALASTRTNRWEHWPKSECHDYHVACARVAHVWAPNHKRVRPTFAHAFCGAAARLRD